MVAQALWCTIIKWSRVRKQIMQFFLTNPNKLNDTLCRLKQAVIMVHPVGVPRCWTVLQVLHLGRTKFWHLWEKSTHKNTFALYALQLVADKSSALTIKTTRTSIFTKIYLSVKMFQLNNSASSSSTGKHAVVWAEVSYIPARCARNSYSSGTHFHLDDVTGTLGEADIFCVIAPFSLQLLEFKASKSHVAVSGLKHTCMYTFLNKSQILVLCVSLSL